MDNAFPRFGNFMNDIIANQWKKKKRFGNLCKVLAHNSCFLRQILQATSRAVKDSNIIMWNLKINLGTIFWDILYQHQYTQIKCFNHWYIHRYTESDIWKHYTVITTLFTGKLSYNYIHDFHLLQEMHDYKVGYRKQSSFCSRIYKIIQ